MKGITTSYKWLCNKSLFILDDVVAFKKGKIYDQTDFDISDSKIEIHELIDETGHGHILSDKWMVHFTKLEETSTEFVPLVLPIIPCDPPKHSISLFMLTLPIDKPSENIDITYVYQLPNSEYYSNQD